MHAGPLATSAGCVGATIVGSAEGTGSGLVGEGTFALGALAGARAQPVPKAAARVRLASGASVVLNRVQNRSSIPSPTNYPFSRRRNISIARRGCGGALSGIGTGLDLRCIEFSIWLDFEQQLDEEVVK